MAASGTRISLLGPAEGAPTDSFASEARALKDHLQSHGWAALSPDSIPPTVSGLFGAMKRYFKRSAAAKAKDVAETAARREEGYLPAATLPGEVYSVEQFIVTLKSPNIG